jgi:hypothetical protein
VGWLVLGLAVYAGYGYAHSVVGRAAGRPAKTPLALKVAAIGFILVAVGLFTIPHQSSPVRLVTTAVTVGAEDHDRTVAGLGLIAVGLLLGLGGSYRAGARAGGSGPDSLEPDPTKADDGRSPVP